MDKFVVRRSTSSVPSNSSSVNGNMSVGSGGDARKSPGAKQPPTEPARRPNKRLHSRQSNSASGRLKLSRTRAEGFRGSGSTLPAREKPAIRPTAVDDPSGALTLRDRAPNDAGSTRAAGVGLMWNKSAHENGPLHKGTEQGKMTATRGIKRSSGSVGGNSCASTVPENDVSLFATPSSSSDGDGVASTAGNSSPLVETELGERSTKFTSTASIKPARYGLGGRSDQSNTFLGKIIGDEVGDGTDDARRTAIRSSCTGVVAARRHTALDLARRPLSGDVGGIPRRFGAGGADCRATTKQPRKIGAGAARQKTGNAEEMTGQRGVSLVVQSRCPDKGLSLDSNSSLTSSEKGDTGDKNSSTSYPTTPSARSPETGQTSFPLPSSAAAPHNAPEKAAAPTTTPTASNDAAGAGSSTITASGVSTAEPLSAVKEEGSTRGRALRPQPRAGGITSFFPRANFGILVPHAGGGGTDRRSSRTTYCGAGTNWAGVVTRDECSDEKDGGDDSGSDEGLERDFGDDIHNGGGGFGRDWFPRSSSPRRPQRRIALKNKSDEDSADEELVENLWGLGEHGGDAESAAGKPATGRPTERHTSEQPTGTVARPNKENRSTSASARSVSNLAEAAVAAVAAGRSAGETMVIDESVSRPLAATQGPSVESAAVVMAAQAVHVEAAEVEAEIQRLMKEQNAAAAAERALKIRRSEEIAAARARAEIAQQPARRRGGITALFLAQRQRTGCRPGGCGGGGGHGVDAGKQAFQRRALSKLFEAGVTTMNLKMGRVVGSRTRAGVVRGHPERAGRLDGSSLGASCVEFDSMGALLAVGGADNVSVYDFDEFLPQVNRVQPSPAGEPPSYLQPTHCIQTRRIISCVRWNPANENQLAVSFLHYDEIRIFDLELTLPDEEAVPVITLVPDGVRGAGGRVARPGGVVGGFSLGGRAGGGGGLGGGGGGGGSSGIGRAAPGAIRGLGHTSFEFVELARQAQSGGSKWRELRVVAGGRGGVFRVWRLGPSTAGALSPYLQVTPSSGSPRGAFVGWLSPRADITAVCCISPDVAVIGTDGGIITTFSLRAPTVKAFGSGKSAERIGQWFLGDARVWGGGGGGSSSSSSSSGNKIFDGASAPGALRIRTVHRSRAHAVGVVVCGLRSGRLVVFDTRLGRVLGMTAPRNVPSPTSPQSSTVPTLFCPAGAGGAWGEGFVAWSQYPLSLSPPQADGGEGARLVYLATSARVGLDASRKGGRDSSLRPGPGWALGEAGGGGFRVAASGGYELVLPMTVKRATPGQSALELSADARGFLCTRADMRLLRTRLVTSSVMIAGEEHSIEAMGSDGMTVVLDRKYRGPLVRLDEDEAMLAEDGAERSRGGGDGSGERESIESASQPPTIVHVNGELSGSSSMPIDEGVREVEQSDRRSRDGQLTGSDGKDHVPVLSEGNGRRSTGGSARSDGQALHERRGMQQNRPPQQSQGSGDADRSSRSQSHTSAADFHPSTSCWDRSWCPTNGVRIFAKLKAVFGDAQMPTAASASRHSTRPNRFDPSSLAADGTGADSEDDIESDTEEQVIESGAAEAPPSESWAALQVVATAPPLDLPVTAITAHPDLSYVLVGLADGTVAALLPGKQTRLGKRRKKSTRRKRQEERGLFPSLWDEKVKALLVAGEYSVG